MTANPQRVTVLIAAHDAEETIARAIRSALAEPETAEVVVVDDASNDGTRDETEALSAQDPRVRLVALGANAGPAAARNRGLEAASAPVVAVLDSDDFFLPGRLARLLAAKDWDLVADNVVFANADRVEDATARRWPGGAAGFEEMGTAAFVAGNLRRRGIARGELGFLKPLISKTFLDSHGLRYNERLRLGEDYDLYVRMLLAGARLKLTLQPGYGAVVRSGSLSARHGTTDLSHLLDALTGHLETAGLEADVAWAMRAYLAEVRNKRDHRRFLDLRRQSGARAAIGYALAAPRRALPIAGGILRDKLGLTAGADAALPADGLRLLREIPDAWSGDGKRGD